MSRALRSLFLCGLALTAAGCLEFEQQTVLMRWDRERDVLQIRLIYEGIYVDPGTAPLKDDETRIKKELKEALADLNDFATSESRFCLLDNWPFEFDLRPPKEGKKDKPHNAFMRTFATVRNGTFFKNAEGKLCGWQDITIQNATRFLKTLNQLISFGIVSGEIDIKGADEESTRLLKKAAGTGHAWVALDDHGLSFRIPAAAELAGEMKRSFFKNVVRTVLRTASKEKELLADPKNKEARERLQGKAEVPFVELFAQNRFSWIEEKEQVTIRLGRNRKGSVQLRWFNKPEYEPNLLRPFPGEEAPPVLPKPIDEDVTTAKLIGEFPPRLPKKQE